MPHMLIRIRYYLYVHPCAATYLYLLYLYVHRQHKLLHLLSYCRRGVARAWPIILLLLPVQYVDSLE